jgi:GAF domain-containing protein
MKFTHISFPFKSRLSLKPLLDFWEHLLADSGCGMSALAPIVQAQCASAPELREPIEDLAILEQKRGLLDLLMSIVFPPAFWEKDCAAAFVPFQFKSFFATPAFKTLFMTEDGSFSPQLNINSQEWEWGRLLKAYLFILQKFYDLDLAWNFPLIARVTCPKTGLDRFFNITLDTKFLDIKALQEPRKLSEEDLHRILANVNDLQVWLELIPPENFEFQGFGVFRAADVTEHEMLSALESDLFENEAIFQREGFVSLQEKLQTYLQVMDLTLGLAAIQGEQILILPHTHKLPEKSCVLENATHHQISDFKGSIFSRAMEEVEPVVIEDLQNWADPSPLEERLLQDGYRSIFVAPLQYQDNLLGTLVLKSNRAGDLNALNTASLAPVLPLFGVALNRSREQLNQRIQTVIKEECTAIHPSVEWRFQQAALNYIQHKDPKVSGLEPIVFDQVYPLFATSDIKSSSDHRNAAVQADLIEHFRLAKEILQLAREHQPLPILAAYIHRLEKQIKGMEIGLQAGDEATKPFFIQQNVEPIFDHLATFGPQVREKIASYRDALDSQMKTIYQNRHAFEASLQQINETIAAYLDQEEEIAQRYFPHYFEKRKTDGVEHTMYIGASMVADGKFCRLYLRNLRLWQLMVTCEIVRRTDKLKAGLPIPLETSHLILVQESPLTIRFSPDERHFEIQGAYDIRHEIIKKRIDKARIKNTTERLTHPGKIAIVYSQRQESTEYLEYIDYLQANGYLQDQIEDVELEDLQGAQGLKALRVTVNLQATPAQDQALPEVVSAAVQAMPKNEVSSSELRVAS